MLTTADYITVAATFILAIMAARLSLYPAKNEHRWYWFGGFIVFGAALGLSTLWQVYQAKSDQRNDGIMQTARYNDLKSAILPLRSIQEILSRFESEKTVSQDVGIEFVSPKDVAFRMVNLANTVLRDPKYSFILIDLDGPRIVHTDAVDLPQILPIPTFSDSGDFLKPKGKFAPRPIVSTFPAVAEIVKPGDRIFGAVTVTCPYCVKERHYWVYFVNGPGGWYYQTTPDEAIKFPYGGIVVDTEGTLAKIAPVSRRIPIFDPKP
jgi:hypothetical protein